MKTPHHGIGSCIRGGALCFALRFVTLFLVTPFMHAQPQRGLEPVQPLPTANGGIGNFYALVIGINDYHAPLPQLKTPVNDAQAVGKVLEQSYGFKVQYLLNGDATRFNILDALGKYEGTLQPADNLVIYFAGHGYLDPKTKRAYWMPYDANSMLSPNRIISDELMNDVSDAPARHVLVISDSCYSGDLANTRSVGSGIEAGTPAVIARMLGRKSRNLMASGGEETVSDTGVDGHSVFAGVLLRALAENVNSMFTASSLFYGNIKDSVVGNSTQTPEYAVIPNSTHNGGDFVFVRNGKAPLPAKGARSTTAVIVPEAEPEGETSASSPAPGAGDFQRSINQLRMTIPNIAAALSSADVRFLKDATTSGVRPAEIEQGLRQKSADGKSTVAQEFFQSAANAPEALAWLDSALKAGLDPNMTVPNDYYKQEGLLISAMRAGNAKAVKMLLENGASPHAYQDLFLTRFEDPRFLYPLQSLAANDRFDLTEKQDLAKAFIAAGVAIPDPAPMKPGARPIPIETAKAVQDETAKQLGMRLPVSPLCCQQTNPICMQASKRTGVDWCAIVAAMPKSLNTAFAAGGGGTPIWDIKLRYLLAIRDNKAYFMGLRDLDNSFTSVDYVLVEVPKDASSWRVLTFISPEAGMGLCKRDDSNDTAAPAENCWREVSLHRVPGTDEMRFDMYKLSWKIGK
ncbi:MAG TPA: caspase family protein [Terracidiphilus sp.]|nr:caspase family protein [Terracidiphilus sp.]